MYMPKYRLWIRRVFFIWIVVIIFLALVYGLFFSPLSPFHYCTLIGCRDAIELTLAHEPSSQYTIIITASSGETYQAICTPGKVGFVDGTNVLCRTGIVTFYGLAPADLTVEVSWQGGTYTASGKPTYEALRPNGLFCPPTCQLGRLSVEIP